MQRIGLILAGVVGGAAVALVAFLPLFSFFLWRYPDCAPNQADGQCGLGTFMDILYAGATSAVLFLIVAIALSILLLHWTRARRLH